MSHDQQCHPWALTQEKNAYRFSPMTCTRMPINNRMGNKWEYSSTEKYGIAYAWTKYWFTEQYRWNSES